MRSIEKKETDLPFQENALIARRFECRMYKYTDTYAVVMNCSAHMNSIQELVGQISLRQLKLRILKKLDSN
jgi:hypothetical protein